MLYALLTQLSDSWFGFNVFRYITFRFEPLGTCCCAVINFFYSQSNEHFVDIISSCYSFV